MKRSSACGESWKAEGFGVLCEVDVQATLNEKLSIDGDPYTRSSAPDIAASFAAVTASASRRGWRSTRAPPSVKTTKRSSDHP
jgi:hypothetical protein